MSETLALARGNLPTLDLCARAFQVANNRENMGLCVRLPLNETKKRVIEAALWLLEHDDCAKLSMSRIAEVAGLSRQAAYRVFATKSDLLKYILNERIKTIGREIAPAFKKISSLEEALVVCTLQAVQAGRRDKLFNNILRESGDHGVEQFVFAGSPEIQELTMGLWSPLIARARSEGRIDERLSDERIVDWIQQIEAVLSMRDDLSLQEQQQVLRDFLVPSILRRST